MVYKVTISDIAVLQECIEFVSFKVEQAPDDYTGKAYPLSSMIIEGRIGTDEKTISLYHWATTPSTDPNCYKEITVEQSYEDQLIRKVTFSKAFVVDYSETHTDKTGIGYFSLYVRQLAGIDIKTNEEGQDSKTLIPPVSSIMNITGKIIAERNEVKYNNSNIEFNKGSSNKTNKINDPTERALDTYKKYKSGQKIADNLEFNQVRDSDMAKKARKLKKEIYEKYKDQGVKETVNVALAKYEIEGVSNEIKAISSNKVTPEGFVGLSDKKRFKTFKADKTGRISAQGFPRNGDTEVKLLSNIDKFLEEKFQHIPKENIKGTVNLHTRLETCGSCLDVIRQFSERYPKINVVVSWEKLYLQ